MLKKSEEQGILQRYGVEVMDDFDVNKIKAYLSDVDECLYTVKDDAHIRYYTKRLKENLSSSLRQDFDAVYELMLSGRTSAYTGRAYDRENDLFLDILFESEGSARIKKVFDTSGTEKNMEEFYENEYIGKFDRSRIFPISDAWDFAAIAAYKCGVDPLKREKAHTETKNRLSKGDFDLLITEKLYDFLDACRAKGIKFGVCSNTKEKKNLEGLLSRIGILGKVDYVWHDAKKLESPYSLFNKVCETFALPAESICAFGNNVLNDLRPAHKIGYKTVFVEIDKGQCLDGVDVKVNNLGSWFSLCLDHIYMSESHIK